MSEKIEDGGPAFPHTVKNDDGTYFACVSGMSLRDWFAGRAMQAALVNSSASDEGALGELFQTVAKLSYAAADAMLAAREGGDV